MSDAVNKNGIIKSYLKLCIVIFVFLLLIISAVEVIIFKRNDKSIDLYKIEINRIEMELSKSNEKIDLNKFKTIKSISKIGVCDLENEDGFFDSENHYVIKIINDDFYRIEYENTFDIEKKRIYRIVNIIMLIFLATTLVIMVYIYHNIIKEFNNISEYPYELAKGNLTVPLKEKKGKYFGKFLWGLDMLREILEEEKRKNLQLQKEKNMFLLSLSHDIKTPISAIKLYAAAIKKGLYNDKVRNEEIAKKIDENANEIEGYVSKIVVASNDDFMNFEVNKGEFYLSEAINSIKKYYEEILSSIGTKLFIERYSDLIVSGDLDRVIEVLQNLLENAIKYGDGNMISITFSDEDGARLVTVSNSGCTLSDTELEHVFDSFYRGQNVGDKPGSGMGLYICKKLMYLMDGDIYAQIDDDVMKVTLVFKR